MMKEDNLDNVFRELKGTFDIAEPAPGHVERFLGKLQAGREVITLSRKSAFRWQPFAVAASLALLVALGIGVLGTRPTLAQQVASISPEVSQSHLYFASLIEDQIKELESETTPETEKLIEDTMIQLNKLETDYASLEQDLLNGGNSKLILSAMITNFQTRIDLLQDVMNKIDAIKKLKPYTDENIII